MSTFEQSTPAAELSIEGQFLVEFKTLLAQLANIPPPQREVMREHVTATLKDLQRTLQRDLDYATELAAIGAPEED
jgi:hypothetical protein